MFRRFFSLGFLLFYTLNVSCVQSPIEVQLPQFARVEQQQVDYYADKVDRELRRNKYVQVGVAVSLLGATGLCGYKVLFGNSGQATLVQQAASGSVEKVVAGATVAKPSNADLIKALENAQDTIKTQSQALVEAGITSDDRGWPAWFKSWGRFFGQQYTLIFLSQIVTDTLNPFAKYFKRLDAAVDGAIAKVFHDGDLNWFVTSHTNIFDLLDQLESAMSPDKNQAEYDALYANSWQLSVQQLSSIAGFMQHKITELEKASVENAQRAQSIVDRFVTLTNQTSDQLEQLASKQEDVTVPSQSALLIQKLRAALQQGLSEFALIEALTIY